MQDNYCFLDFIDPELYSHSTKMSQGINDDKKSLQNFTKAIEGKIEEGSKKTQSLFSSACIYKVPEGLRKLNKSAYTPRVIAIGPLHRKDKHLQESMQRVKWYYTHHLLNRLTEGIEDENQKGRKLSEVLQQCAEKMKDKECVDKAKTYYAAEVTVDDEKMSEMMLVDGCFVLELLYASHSDKKSKEKKKSEEKKNSEEKKKSKEKKNSEEKKKSKEAGKMTTNGVDSGINLKASSSVQKPIDGGEDGSKSSSGGEPPWADPVIHNILTANMIKQDLILLENQIPFFVLEELYKLIVDKIREENKLSLTEYVLEYFDNIWRPNVETRSTKTKTSCCLPDECVLCVYEENEKGENESRKANVYYHILHFLHEHYRPSTTKNPSEENNGEVEVSASELHYAGVKFVSVERDKKPKFSEPKFPFWGFFSARFEIPNLDIHNATEPFLRNLIALEQCCPAVDRYFTSYAKFMDILISSEEDVKVLKKAKVIRNHLGEDKDVCRLFNKLCKEVVLEEFYFEDKCQKAYNYSQHRWPKWRAYWKRTYVESPWGIVAFSVAIIIFGVAVANCIRGFLK